jgi:ribosomal protein S12 methylthiotransferase accessory factor YcaO
MSHVQWQVAVVRVWQHEGRRIIRVTLTSSAGAAPVTTYVASVRAALECLERWLVEQVPDDHVETAGDDSEAVTRRPGDGTAPTVRPGGGP